jgi:hypothetical protein
MARLALCGHRTKALHGPTLEMIRVVTAALNELAIDPAIGHVGVVEGAGELALWGGGEYSAAIGLPDEHDSSRDTCCGHQ